MAEQPAGMSATDERMQRQSGIRRAFVRPELGAMAGAVLVFIHFAVVAGGTGMFAADGIMNWGVVSAQFAIIAVGACLLLIAGEFDLSVGSMIGFAGMIFGVVQQGLFFAGVESSLFRLFLGVILLLAVLLNTYIRRLITEER